MKLNGQKLLTAVEQVMEKLDDDVPKNAEYGNGDTAKKIINIMKEFVHDFGFIAAFNEEKSIKRYFQN